MKNIRRNKNKKIVSKPRYTCMCCKSEFNSQKRFSKKHKKYRNYCPDCRNICYLCLCRHGGQGVTCSKYCSNRYKSIKSKWRKLNPKKNITYLDNALKGFYLKRIDNESLRCIYNLNYIDEIRDNSNSIKEKMISLQESTKLNCKGNIITFDKSNQIYKDSFLFSNNIMETKPIYQLKSFSRFLR